MNHFRILPSENQDLLVLSTETPLVERAYAFKNVSEAKEVPLAQQLFYLPFVKAVTLNGTQLTLERFPIVEWSDVQNEVIEQLEKYLAEGGEVTKTKKVAPASVYAESTPNPAVMKFVANKKLVPASVEFKSIDTTQNAPLAQALFHFPFVKEVYMDENFISITKYEISIWQEVVQQMRTFIREYIAENKPILSHNFIPNSETEANVELNYTPTEKEIVRILDEYIKPAVASDGGNIVFQSFDVNTKAVHVVLQGACSGCPSSTFTLKNGIETMMCEMLPGKVEKVVAING
ncbi:MAG: NifU N-terminal domain-containing protein [Flavobacteriaceae bacterium]|tara:strand:- start:3865 stop:4737 length:873 start_codon:yes stop_codon:yes gene_type:complete